MAKGKLRKLFTDQEILDAYDNAEGERIVAHTEAAKALSELRGVTVSDRLAKYWHDHLYGPAKKNGEPYKSTTVLDEQIREGMTLRTPSALDDMPLTEAPKDNTCILVIPDLHAPYHHQDALEFLIAVAAKYRPTRVINLGDETDGHAISFHDSDPNLDSAGVELEKAKAYLRCVAQVFPRMELCHSNHGSLIFRRAYKHGLPVQYIKTYREILFPEGGGEGWSWHDQIKFKLPNGEDILFQHQVSSDYMLNAAHERSNIVLGHEHGRFEIQYKASSAALYFGLYSGCLIDKDAMAFAYGKLTRNKPILGCTVIVDSQPQLIPMLLDQDGRWVKHLGKPHE